MAEYTLHYYTQLGDIARLAINGYGYPTDDYDHSASFIWDPTLPQETLRVTDPENDGFIEDDWPTDSAKNDLSGQTVVDGQYAGSVLDAYHRIGLVGPDGNIAGYLHALAVNPGTGASTLGWVVVEAYPGSLIAGQAYTIPRFEMGGGQGGFYADDQFITCFTLGTLIETNEGNKPVEELQPGDLIATMDNGYQPIRWIGHTTRDAIDLAQNPKLKPIRIAAGALGNGLPERDLTVSRQHRVLVRSKIAQRMFGAEEVLIPAIKLVGLDGIEIIEDCEGVTYFHILFDKHQVIFSEDAPTESLFTGPIALQSVPPEARKEIETLFPEITKPDFVARSARPIPEKGAQIKQLVARHKKRGMPLLNG